MSEIVRSDSLGSLLRPQWLLETQAKFAAGEISNADLEAAENRAVLETVQRQETLGLDVVTDGELRRERWADATLTLGGLEGRTSPMSYPASVRTASPGDGPRSHATVVAPIVPIPPNKLADEYLALRDIATSRTKYTLPAPSYYRRLWSDVDSRDAYVNCEEFLVDVRDWLASVAAWLTSAGCTYIQLDAPNYGSLCDPDNRAFHAQVGHDLVAELAFDGQLDSSVFDGLHVTSALHVCRGNIAGAWHSQGDYAFLADALFPALDVDAVLLEYDSERAGDFGALTSLRPDVIAVLGLVSTKLPEIEDPEYLRSRIEDAAKVWPLDQLALSTQCGFASHGNNPLSPEEQWTKLGLVAGVADEVWRS